jgi:hypothetical protein
MSATAVAAPAVPIHHTHHSRHQPQVTLGPGRTRSSQPLLPLPLLLLLLLLLAVASCHNCAAFQLAAT